MVQQFRINGIYQMTIDIFFAEPQKICFIVNDLQAGKDHRDIVIARAALACNTIKMPEEIYEMAEQIHLSPIVLFYLGFEVADPLPGINSDHHFVKYVTINGNPDMIQLVPESDGSFSLVRMNGEGLFDRSRKKIIYLDDLQSIVLESYEIELPVRLETINHMSLYHTMIPVWANVLVAQLKQWGLLSWQQVNNILSQQQGILDYDYIPVVEYGLYRGLFRVAANSLGCFIEL